MLGNSIHRSIWKHWEVEERVLGRAWVPACCFIKCQTGLGTDWISGPKISMGCSGRCQKNRGGSVPILVGARPFCLAFSYTGPPRESSLEKISLPRNIRKPPTWFRVSLSVGYGGTMMVKQSIVFVPEIKY